MPNDGIYTATVPMITPGQQKLHLVAKSATFQRETTRDVNVVEGPVVAPAPPPPPPEAQPVVAKPVVKHAAPPAPVAAPAPPMPVEEKGPSLVWVLGGFVLFNLLVGGGVVLFIWWRRYRARTPPAENEAEDADDEESDRDRPKSKSAGKS